MKNFPSAWISPGLEGVAKDSLEKRVQCAQHLEAVDHAQRSPLDGAADLEVVLKATPIGRGIKIMCQTQIKDTHSNL